MSLTQPKLQKALKYNMASWTQNFDIKLIQMVVGVKMTGDWDVNTVQAVYEWQKLRGLDADGMVGPVSWRVITAERAALENDTPTHPDLPSNLDKPLLGLWLDSPKAAKNRDNWQQMHDHGIRSVALMIEGNNESWNPWYDNDDIERICRWAQELKMVVGITDWPFPNQVWMDSMFETLRPMFDPHQCGFPLAFYESDVEGNWRPNKVKGIPNIDKAGDLLVQYKRAVVKDTKARVECTTFTAHTENGRAADVAPHMDRIFAQAYSVRGRTKPNPATGKNEPWMIPWDHIYGPGNMVKLTLDRSLQVPGVTTKVELGCGLAAYDQSWPGHTEQEAMQASYEMALRYNVREIRWWSWMWLFGSSKTRYGRAFLQSIV